MITLIRPDDPRLGEAPGEAFLLAYIQGLAKTAGPGLRREFWLVLAGDGAPAGALCRTESGLWATIGGCAGPEETAAFLAALGDLPGTVDGRLAPLLPGFREPFPVLEYRGPLPEEVPLAIPSAMGLAECNVAAGAVSPSAREELYAELHLRIRRGAAQIFLIADESGKPAAGASALLGESGGIIGHLACRPDRQGQGYGSAALSASVRGILERGKTPFLACREELVPFYTARGFSSVGEIWERNINR